MPVVAWPPVLPVVVVVVVLLGVSWVVVVLAGGAAVLALAWVVLALVVGAGAGAAWLASLGGGVVGLAWGGAGAAHPRSTAVALLHSSRREGTWEVSAPAHARQRATL